MRRIPERDPFFRSGKRSCAAQNAKFCEGRRFFVEIDRSRYYYIDSKHRLRKEDQDMKYVCNVCGWVYDEDEQGTKWEDLPEDFVCELCGVDKSNFSPEE